MIDIYNKPLIASFLLFLSSCGSISSQYADCSGPNGCGLMAKFEDCQQLKVTSEYNQCMADKGDQKIQYQLGVEAIENGEIDKAIRWLQKASRITESRTIYNEPSGYGTLGNYHAQLLLASMYEQGMLVEKSIKLANKYLSMAIRPSQNDKEVWLTSYR